MSGRKPTSARLRKLVSKGSLYRLSGATWWVESSNGWTTAYRIEPVGLQPIVAEVRIFPQSTRVNVRDPEWQPAAGSVPTGGVPAEVVHSVSLSTPFTGLSAAELLAMQEAVGDRLSSTMGLAEAVPERVSEANRLRARVAAMYSVAVQQTRNVNSVIADALGDTYDTRAVTDLVSDARNHLHFLTETEPGKPGGSLTPAGRALLSEQEYTAAVRAIEKALANHRAAKKGKP